MYLDGLGIAFALFCRLRDLQGVLKEAASGLVLGPDCLLCAVGRFFIAYGLVLHISGGYARGLAVIGDAVCIRLF